MLAAPAAPQRRFGDDPRAVQQAVLEHRVQAFRQVEICRRSALYFLENFYWTTDEHERESPEKPLFHGPKLIDNETLMPTRELDGSEDDYLRFVALAWEREPLLAVPKSRQLRLSHLMMGLHGWLGMFHRGQKVAVQSKKFEDADALLGRLDNSLDILARKFPTIPWPEHTRKEGRILWPAANSVMVAIAQGAEKTRSYTYSAILCVAPQTRVLTHDLRWVEAGSLREGDELAGFDEDPPAPTRQRQWQKAVVKAAPRLVRPCYRLLFSDGTEVVCSAEHRWLAGHGQHQRFLTTEQLRVATERRAGSKVVKLVEMWGEPDRDYEAGYLAAAFDGEGSFDQRPYEDDPDHGNGSSVRVQFAQNDNAMWAAVHAMLERKGFQASVHELSSQRYSSTHRHAYIAGRTEMMRFLGQIRPRRMLDQLDLNLWGALRAVEGVELLEKEFLGARDVIGLSTSTRTFVAEGLASHNSDETAFQDRADEAYNAAVPTIEGGGKYTMVSTADPGFFEEIVFDKLGI
ncbi:MAG: hypothetical protein ACODAG_06135 [Myxococcota bacterium]